MDESKLKKVLEEEGFERIGSVPIYENKTGEERYSSLTSMIKYVSEKKDEHMIIEISLPEGFEYPQCEFYVKKNKS